MKIATNKKFRHYPGCFLGMALVGLAAIAAYAQGYEKSPTLKVAEWPVQSVFNTDGHAPYTIMDGSLCVRTAEKSGIADEFGSGKKCTSVHLYFAIDDEFLRQQEVRQLLARTDAQAYVRVEYYSSGQPEDFIKIEYDSIGHAYESTAKHCKPRQPGWYQHTFVLWNPLFNNRQNMRADFRITNCGDGDEFVRKVELILDPKQAGIAQPALSVPKIEWSNGYTNPLVQLLVQNTSPDPLDFEVKLSPMNAQTTTVDFQQQQQLSSHNQKQISIETGRLPPGTYLFNLEILSIATAERLYRACHRLTVPAMLEILPDHPRYRSTLYPGDENKTIAGHVQVRDDLPTEGSLLISLMSQDGSSINSKKIEQPRDKIPFEFDAAALNPGNYSIQASLLDKDNNELARATHEIRKVSKGAVEVRIRDDNVLLVDGKPFFPRGVYFSGGSIENLPDIADLGFNTVMAGPGLALSDQGLALAEKHNLWYTIPSGQSAEKVAEQVAAHGKCPRLLGWYTFDEPDGNQLDPKLFHEVYQAQLHHDPHRFVFTAFFVPEEFERYFNDVDIVMIDPYVVSSEGSNDLTAVATTMELARQAAGDRKPVWLIPQAFGYTLQWLRLPTLWEERCMVYLGIVHGAKGIFFFNYAAAGGEGWLSLGDDAHLRNAAKRINRELQTIEPVLISQGGELEVTVKCPRKIHCLVKRWDKDICLIAVNPYDAYLEASFQFPAFDRLGKVRELFDEHDLAVSGKLFSDIFRPYSVHVYKISF